MRKRKPKKRVLQPDPRFKDPVVTQFVNNLMWQGKKNTAFEIFYDAMDKIQERTGENPHEVWAKSVENAIPTAPSFIARKFL